MTLAFLIIWAAEVYWLVAIIQQYSAHLEIDEFLTNAPLDKILQARHHQVTSIIMLGLATITAWHKLH